MAELKTVGVKELKNKLSYYLREVKLGTRVLVTDRNVVIAELSPPLSVPTNPFTGVSWIRPATKPKTPLKRTGVRLSEGTAQEILDELREDRFP